MSSNHNRGGSDISWPLIIIAFALFWPVGLFLLIAKLKEESENSGRQDWQDALDDVRREARNVKREFQKDFHDIGQNSQNRVPRATNPTTSTYNAHPYTQHSARDRMGMNQDYVEAEIVQEQPGKAKPRYNAAKSGKKKGKQPKIKGGKGLMIAGAVIAGLFGLGAISVFADALGGGMLWAVQESLLPFALTGVGAGMFLWGGFKNKKARKFRKMLNMIGDSKQLDIQVLAEAVPCSYNQACDTLQDMIDEGLLGDKAYIDMSTGYLMLDGKGLGERKAKKKAEKPAEQVQPKEDDEMAVLAEIRRVNEEIPDPELSRKIDRIEEITKHILDYQKKHPDKAPELHKFLNYYLPTTLKILNSYAELDRQGVDGDNISTTKERIEKMMDKIVEGFETQLDKLFEGDMLDISSDISVMEKMLSRDGLSGGMRMPRPGEEARGPRLTLDPESMSAPMPAAEPTPIPTPEPAPAPVAEPIPTPEPMVTPMPEPMPTPDPTTFTTPGGISLTLNPEGDSAAQAAPGWEDGFYRRTKEDLEGEG